MKELHPDLAALAARYKELYDAATEGHVSGADALATLAGISVTDGHGAVWSIGPDGEFLRAQFTGAPQAKTAPDAFVGPETVVSNPETGMFDVGPGQAPTAPTWDAPQQPTPGPAAFGSPAPGPAPFGAPAAGPQPFGGPPASPGQGFATAPDSDPFASAPVHNAGMFEPHAAQQYGAPLAAAQPWDEPSARSLSDQEERIRRGGSSKLLAKLSPSEGFGAVLARNKFLVLILVVGLALLGAAFFKSGGSAGSDLPAENPGFSAPTGQGDGDAPNSADALPQDEPTSAPKAASKLPAPDDERKVLAALESGDRKTIASLTASQTEPATMARSSAFFAGLDETGLKVARGPAAAAPNGAIQEWSIKDGNNVVVTVTVTWVLDGTTWKLSAVPVP